VPIPIGRDPEKLHAQLQQWFDRQSDAPKGLRVQTDLDTPRGVGNANETILFSVVHDRGDTPCTEQLVLRLEPTAYTLFMDADLGHLCDVIRALDRSVAFPVPDIRWYEPDASVLGAPFCIMTRAPGRVPPDNDPGVSWVLKLPVAHQRRIWDEGFRTMCSIHVDDGRGPAEALLRERLHGRTGVEEQLDYWARFPAWAELDDHRIDHVRAWLDAHRPASTTTSLSWGDARLENMIFDDDRTCAAVLDWEMVSLGGPLMDLGWWLNWDELRRAGVYPIPEGYGTRAETLARWDECTGIATDGLEWYEMFAAYRLANIVGRVQLLGERLGAVIPSDLVASALASTTGIVDAVT
jgi:aminoglycoside phosphotransferase (APT) family kinase protein